MSTSARRRLMRDFKRLQDDPPPGVSGAPCDSNILQWNAVIFGPSETPFEDGTFKLTINFTEEYPNKAPTVRFVSKMFHPNVYANGSICLDILQNRWSPTYDVSAILTSIQSLLDEPNPNSPANSLAAKLYQENRREYAKRVEAIVEKSWYNFPDGESGDKEGAKNIVESSEEGGGGASTSSSNTNTTINIGENERVLFYPEISQYPTLRYPTQAKIFLTFPCIKVKNLKKTLALKTNVSKFFGNFCNIADVNKAKAWTRSFGTWTQSGLVNFGLVHPLDHNLIVDDIIDIEDISSDDDEIPDLE